MGFRRSVRVFRILGGKTRQPTRRLRVLEAENRHRPSPASGRPVLGPDQTIFSGGSGTSFLWTALGGPHHLSTIPLKNFHLFKITESVINFYLKKFSN